MATVILLTTALLIKPISALDVPRGPAEGGAALYTSSPNVATAISSTTASPIKPISAPDVPRGPTKGGAA